MPPRRRLLVLMHLALAVGAFALGWGAHRRAVRVTASNASDTSAVLPARPAPPGSASKANTGATNAHGADAAPDDPAAFIAWAKRVMAHSPPTSRERSDALESLVHRNVEAARQVADLAGQEGLWDLFQTFARVWGQTHFQEALAWAKSQDGRARTEALSALVDAINPEYAAEASRSLLPELPRGSVRARALQNICSEWTNRDPVQSFEWIQSLPIEDVLSCFADRHDPFDQDFGIPDLLKASPQAVAAFVASLPGNDRTIRLMRVTARELAGIDPSSALEWANALPAAGARSDCVDTIWKNWAQTDLKEATTRALAEADPHARQRAIESIADNIIDGGGALEGAAEIQAWIDSLPADTRLTAEGQALLVLEEEHPSVAAERLAQLLTSADGSVEPLRNVAAEIGAAFTEDSPTQAADWVRRLPDGTVQMQAASGVSRRWFEIDPVAAGEWVARLPAGAARDGAAAGLAGALASSDPEAAFQWAESVGTAGVRAQALQSTIDDWKHIDRAAARQAIEASALAPAEKTPLIYELEAP